MSVDYLEHPQFVIIKARRCKRVTGTVSVTRDKRLVNR